MKNKGTKNPKNPKRVRREYGPSYFVEKMSGLTTAAKQLQKEEHAFEQQPMMTDKIQ